MKRFFAKFNRPQPYAYYQNSKLFCVYPQSYTDWHRITLNNYATLAASEQGIGACWNQGKLSFHNRFC